jgi:hypothetical protein
MDIVCYAPPKLMLRLNCYWNGTIRWSFKRGLSHKCPMNGLVLLPQEWASHHRTHFVIKSELSLSHSLALALFLPHVFQLAFPPCKAAAKGLSPYAPVTYSLQLGPTT